MPNASQSLSVIVIVIVVIIIVILPVSVYVPWHAVTGKRNAQHITENLKAMRFAFDSEDHAELAEALSHGKMLPGDCGDEYRGQ